MNPHLTLDGERSDLVVYVAGSRFDGPPGHDRNMAQALSRHCPVLFVEPPLSVLTRLRNPELAGLARHPPVRVLGPRFAHLVPWVVPGMTRPGLHHLVAPMMRRAVRSALAKLYGRGRSPVAAVVSCRVENLWPAVAARRRVYYSTDDLVAGAELLGLPRQRLLREEARTLRGADAVAAVSPPLCERYRAAGYPAHLIPNGCRPDLFVSVDTAPLPADVTLPGPVAGFVGHLNDRIDLRLLEAVADTGASLLVVGPCAAGFQPDRFLALAARPNVCWVGPKPVADLPGYLRLIDVGLTPYADTAFNRASFPLKTLEYLAAGRAVVATALPATLWLNTPLIEVADTPAEFARRVHDTLTVTRTETLAARRRAFAHGHSWDRRAEQLAALIDIVAPAQKAAA